MVRFLDTVFTQYFFTKVLYINQRFSKQKVPMPIRLSNKNTDAMRFKLIMAAL